MVDVLKWDHASQNANASKGQDKKNILKVLAQGDPDYETSSNIAQLNKDVREKVAEWYTTVAVKAAERRIERKGTVLGRLLLAI